MAGNFKAIKMTVHLVIERNWTLVASEAHSKPIAIAQLCHISYIDLNLSRSLLGIPALAGKRDGIQHFTSKR